MSTFAPGLDFRSVFTDSGGNVYARQFASPTIYKQSSPGVFGSLLTLTGGSLDAQSDVVLNSAGIEYIAMNAGTVDRWNLSGAFLGTVSLSGFGVGSENTSPQNRGIIAAGGYFLTYDNAGKPSAWDSTTGARVDTTILNGAGTSFDSGFSLSFTNGKVWVVDSAGGTWRGYDVGLGGPAGVPEPATMTMLAGGLGLLLFRKLRK